MPAGHRMWGFPPMTTLADRVSLPRPGSAVEADIDAYIVSLLEELRTLPDGDTAARRRLRDDVIRAAMPIARRAARRFRGRGEPVEDLNQVAIVGLIKAVDRFDARRGTPFTG